MSLRHPMVIVFLAFLATIPYCLNLALAGNPFAGEKIYARYCLSCHGKKGEGVMANTPDFSWRGSGRNGLGVVDQKLAKRILTGKHTCPSFQGILSQEDVMNVITHLRTLR